MKATTDATIAGMITGIWIVCLILYGVPFLIGTLLIGTIGAAATVVAHVGVEAYDVMTNGEEADDDDQ